MIPSKRFIQCRHVVVNLLMSTQQGARSGDACMAHALLEANCGANARAGSYYDRLTLKQDEVFDARETVEAEAIYANGWFGSDLSLETSLMDYGLCFREYRGRLYVIHPCSHGNGYAMSAFDLPLDFRKEFGWVKWDKFFSDAEIREEDWKATTDTNKIRDLVAAYGVENVFGTDYAKDGHYVFLKEDDSILFTTTDKIKA